ncbi:MAG: hypothetical protein HKL88_05795 [Bacteroidia bacterium]|jgi:hypothetical protein|nr:hypothetical protein [Bacteroidia bacterium]
MKKITLILAVLTLSSLTSRAQFLDSIQAAIGRKGSFTFSFNTRNSYIGSSGANIWGFMAGVCFSRKFAAGGGLNILNNYIGKTETVGGQTVNAQLKFTYISYYVEYIIRLQKHWEIDIPVAIGAGGSNYTYYLNGAQLTQNSHFIVPLEPQVEVDYDFLKNKFGNYLFGLYVQVGYRYMLDNNPAIGGSFNSSTYATGILLFPFEIYSAIFPRTGLARMIEGN